MTTHCSDPQLAFNGFAGRKFVDAFDSGAVASNGGLGRARLHPHDPACDALGTRLRALLALWFVVPGGRNSPRKLEGRGPYGVIVQRQGVSDLPGAGNLSHLGNLLDFRLACRALRRLTHGRLGRRELKAWEGRQKRSLSFDPIGSRGRQLERFAIESGKAQILARALDDRAVAGQFLLAVQNHDNWHTNTR